jgi:hypothetical protein
MTLHRLLCSPARVVSCLVALLTLLFLTACGGGNLNHIPEAATENAIQLDGFVRGGQQPISGATVQLYAVGTSGDMSAAAPLITAPFVPPVTDGNGAWSITGLYTCPSITAEVYLIASGGNPGLAPGTNNTASVLMSALGPCGNLSSATHTIINEVSTIGSIYPITPFMSSYLKVGSNSGDASTLAADFMQINEYIDTSGGQSPGPALPGGFTAPVANLNTLANSMADCTNSTGSTTAGTPCGNLFLYATPSGGSAPTNTADAILDIANNPFQNVNNIFLLSTASPAFQPVLSAAPPDWTLKILPNIALTTPSNLVGVGSTTTGTITLGQAAPAGGLQVSLVSSSTAAVTVVSPVNIAAGATTASFSYTGVASGTSTITASATGYYGGSTTLSATSALISLGTVPVVAPGQATSLPLSLGTPAPVGGVTINFTSTNTAVATVTPSVFIAAGLQVPVSNPQVTGVTVGTATINATATGYAPGSRNVSVSVAASLPATFSVPLTTPTNETLTISAPAPTGGITFTLAVDNPTIFSVPSSVTVPAGSTTVNIPITGLVNGTTNLRADSPNITEAVSAVTVNGTINLQAAAITTGKQLQVSSYFYFASAPPAGVTATITSNNPLVAVASGSPTVQGGTVASIPGITSTSANTFYVQGVGVGSAVFTIAATGYTSTNISITVDPSGFVIYTPGSITTTSLSSDSSLTILPAILNPGTSAVLGYGSTTPAASVSVPVTSGTTTVGTITNSPLAFTANTASMTANFHPVGAGTTSLSLSTPAGFTTPTPASTQQITATVTAPPINVQTATLTSGAGLEVSTYAYLSQTPVSPTIVTVTSSNPAVAVVSSSATTAGTGTLNIPAIVSTSAFTYYVQGLAVGSTTLTISATPYTSATVNVTVDPAGFVIYTPGSITTTSLSPASPLTILPAILNPGTLTVIGYGSVDPQFAPVNVPLTSGTTTVGTIATSPLVFHGGDSSQAGSFQPVGAGTSTLSIGTPAGFSTPTPTSTQQITATVTAPPINVQTTSLTTGSKLEVSSYVYLSQTPTAPITVTLVSDTPSVATISTSPTLAGAASNTFPNTVSTSALTFYVQGQLTGTANITVSAPGYTSATISVTVDPSGFVIYTPGNFTTTTFSSPTSISILPAILNASSLGVVGYGSLNPGIATVSVPFNSSSTPVGTVTSAVTFSGGSSSGIATFTPVAAGMTNLSLTQPAGFSTPTPAATQSITATVTAPPINVQTTTITTGQTLEVSTYAYLSQTPPSAVSLTITSSDPTIATLSTSPTTAGTTALNFPGLTSTSALTYYIQGHNLGTVTLTLAAAGFSNATVNVTVDPSGFVIYTPGNFNTTTFSTATSVTILPAILTPGTLTVLGYGTLSPGAGSPQVTVTSGTTSVGTVTSPVTFSAGASSGTFSFQPVSAGTSILSIAQPAGYSLPAPASTQQITATVTAPPVNVQTTSINTGQNLQVSTYAYLSQTPPVATNLSITSSNPSVAVLSTSSTIAGSAVLNFPGVTSTSALTYYVQGLATGTSNLTIAAAGFTSATVTVTVSPSGFVIYTPGNFSTTTFSAATSVTVLPAILNSGVLTVAGYATLNPGASASVPVTSATTTVGTVTSPVLFAGGSSTGTFSFQPVAAGSTLLSLGAVAGFTTPSQSSTQQITATVTAPPVAVQTNTITTGALLQVGTYAYLSTTPPAPVNLTITSANPAIATVSTSNTVVGTGSLVFNNVSTTSAFSYYIQGQAVGSTTITVSAPGFSSINIAVTVDPSGFVIYSPGNFSTTAGAASSTITIVPAVLNSGLLTIQSYAALNPGIGSVSVPVGSTSPQIGTVSSGSIVFTAGSTSGTVQFTPLMSGSTDVVIVSQPTGFTTPSQPATQQIVVTVN